MAAFLRVLAICRSHYSNTTEINYFFVSDHLKKDTCACACIFYTDLEIEPLFLNHTLSVATSNFESFNLFFGHSASTSTVYVYEAS